MKIYKALYLIILLTSLSCVNTPSKKEIYIDVTIEHLKAKDSWRVTYQLPTPVTTLLFSRNTNLFRRAHWKVLSPDIELRQVIDSEVLVSKSGQVFDRVTLEHKSYYEYTPKDYEFFFKYSGGDVLMYTGHYDVYPLLKLETKSDEIIWPENRPKTRFHFLPVDGEKVVILGNVYRQKKVSWVDVAERGTYIYWGNTEPLDTGEIVAVTDKAVPDWVKSRVRQELPRLFKYYKEKTDVALNFKPVVFLSYSKPKLSGFYNAGGTLPGLIQLSMSGDGWLKESQESLEVIMKFLAHEAAHLWNGQMFNYSGMEHSWMHEGGADAFAFRAMRDLGVFSKERYLEYLNASLNKCILDIDGYPLKESSTHRKFKNYYYCGSTLAWLTELVINERDVYSFWRRLFRRIKKKADKKYGHEDYFRLLEEKAEDKEVVELMKSIVYGPYKNAGKSLKSAFIMLGQKVRPLPESNKNMSKRILRKLVVELYAQDCQGRRSLTRKKTHYLMHGEKFCQTFKKDFHLVGVNGYSVFAKPHAAYRSASRSCQKTGRVVLENQRGETINFKCKTLPGPLNFFEVVK